MRQIKWFGSLMICVNSAIAATNPIAWSLNQEFQNPVYTGSIYSVTYTFTNKLPIQLQHPLVIEKTASPATEFTYIDNCTGTRLTPNQSCTVKVQLNALIAGEKYVQLSIAGYDDNVVPLPQLVTSANATIFSNVIGQFAPGLPNSMSANTNANYVVTFTNYSDIDADPISVTVTQTTGTPHSTNTCNIPLAKNGGTCTVTGTFTPTSNTPTIQSVNVSLNYSGPTGSPATTSSSTNLVTPIPGGPIVGSVATGDGLPPLMTPGEVTTGVQFLFTNTSNTQYTFTDTPTVSLTWSDSDNNTGPCTAVSTPSCRNEVNNCVASLAESPAACNVTLDFTAPSAPASTPPITYTVHASLAYNNVQSPATASTSGTVISALPTERTIKMVNNCGFALSYSLNGSAAPCVQGVTVADSSGACFWQNYVGNSNILAANTGTDYVTIPANNIGGTQWSGNISAMLGCTNGTNCTQAICGNGGVGNCAVSVGFNQPATQAEITMLTNAADNYDVEVINGFSIPISMTPYYYIDRSNPNNDIPAVADNFSCGVPGNYFTGGGKENGFGSCSWEAAAIPSPSSYYYFVGGGSGRDCSNCATGEVCGLSQPTANGNIIGPVCGNFQGYWTPNELCTQSYHVPSDVVAGLQCNTALPADFNLLTDPYGNTYTSLMACHVAKGYTGPIYNSCYTPTYTPPGQPDQCCGCVDWWDPTQTNGTVILANNTSQTCPSGHTDPYWTGNIQTGIQWMKKACPSAYVYPFDDQSSKFSCTNGTQSGANSTSYVITFCAGNSGLPSGSTIDGRTNPPLQ